MPPARCAAASLPPQVNKVAGNFHVAPGRAFSSPQGHLVHEFKPFQMSTYNTSHEIHALSFGPHYPSQVGAVRKRSVGEGVGGGGRGGGLCAED
jgi:hypothetical protein